MIEIIICDADGIEQPEFGRRFHDSAPREVLVDDTPYDFVSFTEPGVAVYHRRRQTGGPAAITPMRVPATVHSRCQARQ